MKTIATFGLQARFGIAALVGTLILASMVGAAGATIKPLSSSVTFRASTHVFEQLSTRTGAESAFLNELVANAGFELLRPGH